MAVRFGLCCIFSVVSLLLPGSHGYFVTVDAHAMECFFDKVTTGMKMSLMFEVVEGGFLDIDVEIMGPDGRVIHTVERETNGKYTFTANADGVYKYCFSNKMSSMTPKVVMFSMEIGDAPKEHDKGDEHGRLAEMVSELSTGLSGVKHEQEYMEVRERIHRMINDNTNSRVVWWAVFESFLLIAMAFGQIYYLKRFFEVRRVI